MKEACGFCKEDVSSLGNGRDQAVSGRSFGTERVKMDSEGPRGRQKGGQGPRGEVSPKPKGGLLCCGGPVGRIARNTDAFGGVGKRAWKC